MTPFSLIRHFIILITIYALPILAAPIPKSIIIGTTIPSGSSEWYSDTVGILENPWRSQKKIRESESDLLSKNDGSYMPSISYSWMIAYNLSASVQDSRLLTTCINRHHSGCAG